jgi:hypothetical protein
MRHDLLIAGMMMLTLDQAPAPRPLPPMPRPSLPVPAPVMRPPPMPDRMMPSPRPRESASRFVVCPADPRCRRHRRPVTAVPD